MTTHISGSWPLFKNDGRAVWPMSNLQRQYLSQLKEKIHTQQYTFISNPCLCGAEPGNDLLISQKDRFGLPVNVVMCSHCGLLRNEMVFSQESCAQFYKEDYHGLVFGEKIPPRSYFNEQNERGLRFYNIVKNELGDVPSLNVVEIGAGCGGVLYPFARRGCKCVGFEFNEHYMRYGRARGLDLRHTSELDAVPDGSVDLVILSHVLEHVSNPSELLATARRILRSDGLLVVEVPGVMNLNNEYSGLLAYLVIAHFFHYTGIHLQSVLGKEKFKVLSCDETVTCLAQKTEDSYCVDIPEGTVGSITEFLQYSAAKQTFPSFRNYSIKQQAKALLKRCPGFKSSYAAFVSARQTLDLAVKQFGCHEGLSDCKHKEFVLDAIDCTTDERDELERRLRFYVHNDAVLLPDEPKVSHLPRLVFGKDVNQSNCFDVDWRANFVDGWVWCNLTSFAYEHTPCTRISKKRFSEKAAGLQKFSKAYVFGTGPSLEDARERNWADGYRIVCNTIVRDKELWDHIDPHFIVAGDAIYHFGCDDFAKAFRHDLQARLVNSNALFLYPDMFDAIVRKTMNVDPRNLVPVPMGSHKFIHCGLQRKFSFPALGNVLPMLLTVACSLAKHVCLWGFDGKAPGDTLFWKNSSLQHYPEHVPALQKAHPMFYNHYVPDDRPQKYIELVQGEELDHSLSVAEKEKFSFEMLHHSWTAILQKRMRSAHE